MSAIPVNASYFSAEFTGKLDGAAFREMSGLGSEHEVTQQRVTGEKGKVSWIQIPGNTKWQPVTLKQGIVTDPSVALKITEWRKESIDGKYESSKANGSISLFSQSGDEVARWEFEGAWPSKLSGPTPNANSNEVAIEELTITYDSFYRSK